MSKPYDVSGKELFELAPAGWLAALGQPRPSEKVRMIDADLSSTVTTTTDKVIHVDDPQPWIVMIELQANWDGDLPFDLLRRYAQLRHRHRLPVSCAVILMRPEANSSGMTGEFPQENPLGSEWGFPFTVFRVWEQPVDTFLNGPLGLLPFAPIARINKGDDPRVKSIIQERILSEATRSQGETLRTALVQLLALRYKKKDIVEFWSDLMATLDISRTELADMFRDEGRLQGKLEGRLEGKLEGRLEGKLEGRLEEGRDAILTFGEEKFGPISETLKAKVDSIADLEQLRSLQRRILSAKGWKELLTDPE